jgi:phosphoribosyl 1,2-cyclic phosphodiesterase
MRARFWGVRGSVAVAEREALGYGGNTSCVSVELDSGHHLVLDAGTGIRALGARIDPVAEPIHILLTHLHLDHISGLLFFAPLFDPRARVTVWGPDHQVDDLRKRLARYLSTPLSPVEIRDLPARVEFRACPDGTFRIGQASITTCPVIHRGPTIGYRIEEDGASLAYIPDHEPALGQNLDRDPSDWISGYALAAGASLLIHDGQYTEAEYAHTVGWGHSDIAGALAFAKRSDAQRVALFHHDPGHDDAMLDDLADEARSRWTGDAELSLAREGETVELV